MYESNCYLDMLCMYIYVIVYYRTREKMGGNMLYNDLKKRLTKHEINLYMEHIKEYCFILIFKFKLT